MRLFFGVGLPGGVRKEVWNFCSSIKEKLPRMKWVEEENLHVTLKFLGEVAPTKLTALTQASEDASHDIKGFPITLGALGAFPDPKRARVFWWGLKEGNKECTELFERLEARLVESGFPREEKSFHPHITLSRLNPPQALLPLLPRPPAGGLAPEKNTVPEIPAFNCNKFTLYESVLRPQGPLYKTVKEFNLA